MELVKLQIHCPTILNTTHTENLSGFLFQHKDQLYIMSVHHYLPIDFITGTDTGLVHDLAINSCWSEALILNAPKEYKQQYLCFKKTHNKLNLDLIPLFSIINGERCEFNFIGIEFRNFDEMSNSPEIPYILLDPKTNHNFAGNSGSPVFTMKDSETILVGVFSKFNVDSNIIYVIPIYIYIRNLKKKDNTNIYGINMDLDAVTKINTHNIRKSHFLSTPSILFPPLNINIPVSTYFLFEGDTDAEFTITLKIKKKVSIIENVNTIIINDNLIVSHEDSLLFNDSEGHKLNIRLMSLIKRIMSHTIREKIYYKIESHHTVRKNNNIWLDFSKAKKTTT